MERDDENFFAVLETARACKAVRRKHWRAMREILEGAVIEHGRSTEPSLIHSPGEKWHG